MKIIKYILFILLMIVSTTSFSQRWKLSRYEYSYGLGMSNYFGDIGGAIEAGSSAIADFDIAYSRPGIAVGYRYRLYDRVAVKANLIYINMHGSDVKSSNENRDYAFTTNMFELYGHIEYHITEEKQMQKYSIMSLRDKVKKYNTGVNFYVFAGIGGAYIKPKALDSFEGSSRFDDSHKIALVVPFGLGLRYPLSPKSTIGLEIGARYTTSDYIDGFSPELSETKDIYYFTVINVSYKIAKTKRRY